jgi:hypothetical protein
VSGIAGNVDMNYAPTLDTIRKLASAPSTTAQSLKASIAAMRVQLAAMDQLVTKL